MPLPLPRRSCSLSTTPPSRRGTRRADAGHRGGTAGEDVCGKDGTRRGHSAGDGGRGIGVGGVAFRGGVRRLFRPPPGGTAHLDVVRAGLETPVKTDPDLPNLLALAQVCLLWETLEATPPTWSLSITATVSMTRAKSPGSPSGRGSRTNSRSPSSESVLRMGCRSGRRTSEAFRRGSGRCAAGRRSRGPGGAARSTVRFLLGESGQLRYAGPTVRLHRRGADPIGNPLTIPHRRTALDREKPLDGPQGASPSTRPGCGMLIGPR